MHVAARGQGEGGREEGSTCAANPKGEGWRDIYVCVCIKIPPTARLKLGPPSKSSPLVRGYTIGIAIMVAILRFVEGEEGKGRIPLPSFRQLARLSTALLYWLYLEKQLVSIYHEIQEIENKRRTIYRREEIDRRLVRLTANFRVPETAGSPSWKRITTWNETFFNSLFLLPYRWIALI